MAKETKKFTKESVILDSENASIHRVSYTSGQLKITANAECIDKKFIGITFPCITNGTTQVGGSVVWNGNGFSEVEMSAENEEAVKDFLKDFANALAKEYNFTITEMPEIQEMHEPTESVEQSNG